jgi:hypothetical protein
MPDARLALETDSSLSFVFAKVHLQPVRPAAGVDVVFQVPKQLRWRKVEAAEVLAGDEDTVGIEEGIPDPGLQSTLNGLQSLHAACGDVSERLNWGEAVLEALIYVCKAA